MQNGVRRMDLNGNNFKIINGNSEEVLKSFPDNHFDAVVCDPPYLIDFLGKDWDHNKNDLTPIFKECLRVLKPGAYLLAFSATRTYHRMATMIDNAGFDIKDMICWIYSSGFPKGQDTGKAIQKALDIDSDLKKSVKITHPIAQQWIGWNTNLKPASEPIVMARKPTKLAVAQNVLKYGVGAINIDGSRVPYSCEADRVADDPRSFAKGNGNGVEQLRYNKNVKVKDYAYKNTGKGMGNNYFKKQDVIITEEETWKASDLGRYPSNIIGEIPDYQKYYYCPKPSKKERSSCDNNHPTVKPIELMAYLCKLITPKDGHILDPFCGSGTTGIGAIKNNFKFTGVELDERYANVAKQRIKASLKNDLDPELFDISND